MAFLFRFGGVVTNVLPALIQLDWAYLFFYDGFWQRLFQPLPFSFFCGMPLTELISEIPGVQHVGASMYPFLHP